MTLRATGIYFSPFPHELPDRYAHRRLIVEVDGDVLRMETAATSQSERDQPYGSPGVTLEVELEQVPLLIERIRDALRVSGAACAVDGEPWPCEAVQHGRDRHTPHRML